MLAAGAGPLQQKADGFALPWREGITAAARRFAAEGDRTVAGGPLGVAAPVQVRE